MDIIDTIILYFQFRFFQEVFQQNTLSSELENNFHSKCQYSIKLCYCDNIYRTIIINELRIDLFLNSEGTSILLVSPLFSTNSFIDLCNGKPT